jgi:hypothetical protein
MNTPEIQATTTPGRRPELHIHVTVNGRPVELDRRQITGLEIKEAAIAQHVAIELSFILQEELPNRRH